MPYGFRYAQGYAPQRIINVMQNHHPVVKFGVSRLLHLSDSLTPHTSSNSRATPHRHLPHPCCSGAGVPPLPPFRATYAMPLTANAIAPIAPLTRRSATARSASWLRRHSTTVAPPPQHLHNVGGHLHQLRQPNHAPPRA